MIRFHSSFSYMIQLSYQVVSEGLASPTSKHSIQEAVFPGSHDSHGFDLIAKRSRGSSWPVSELHASPSKRARLEVHAATELSPSFRFRGQDNFNFPGLVGFGRDLSKASGAQDMYDVPMRNEHHQGVQNEAIAEFNTQLASSQSNFPLKSPVLDFDASENLLSLFGYCADIRQSPVQSPDDQEKLISNLRHAEQQSHSHHPDLIQNSRTESLDETFIDRAIQHGMDYYQRLLEEFDPFGGFVDDLASKPDPVLPAQSSHLNSPKCASINIASPSQSHFDKPPYPTQPLEPWHSSEGHANDAHFIWDHQVSQATLPATSQNPTFFMNVKKPHFTLRQKKLKNLCRSNKELVDQYCAIIQERLDLERSDLKNCCSKSPVKTFTGVSATAYELFGTQGRIYPFIRVVNNGAILSSTKLMDLILSLIRWLLLNYQALRLNIKDPPLMGIASEKALVFWLADELFSPMNSLPVYGRGTCVFESFNETNFGALQKYLIAYLSSSKPSDVVGQTATTIIGIWFKESHLQWWETKFGTRSAFQDFMESSFHSMSISGLPPAELPKTEASLEPTIMGNFHIFHLDTSLLEGLPQVSEIPEITMRLKKDIFAQLTRLYDGFKISRSYDKEKLGLLPLAAIELKSLPRPKERVYIIRLLNSYQRLVSSRHVKLRLDPLLECLANYHKIFEDFLAKDPRSVISPKLTDFFDWLKDELFGPKTSLPIFGTITESLRSKNKVFGEIQIIISRYLAGSAVQLKKEQMATALLGYWYKKMHTTFWENICHDDKEYWELMSQALKKKLESLHGYKRSGTY